MEIIDATDTLLGRMSSYVAKKLLQGEEIIIVNAEKCAISGNKVTIFKEQDIVGLIDTEEGCTLIVVDVDIHIDKPYSEVKEILDKHFKEEANKQQGMQEQLGDMLKGL